MNSVFFMYFLLAFILQFINGTLASCIHGGTKYKEGDYFPPNKTFIKTEGPLQCVQCRCHHGLVVCEIENCTVPECQEPVKYPQFCCLRCPDDVKPIQGPSDFIFNQSDNQFAQKKKPKNDCQSNGQIYANGSIWQPVIGPFGAMACVQCQCRDGSVICGRLKCNDQPCSRPIREFGECCPVCPETEKEEKMPASCLPKASELFVFKTPNVQNDSETIAYAFLENTLENGTVTFYIWDLRPKSSLNALTVKLLNRREMEKWDFQLLGSVSRKRYKKFSERGDKLQRKCFAQCLKKIQRLENSLGIYPTTLKSECTQNEINVSNI